MASGASDSRLGGSVCLQTTSFQITIAVVRNPQAKGGVARTCPSQWPLAEGMMLTAPSKHSRPEKTITEPSDISVVPAGVMRVIANRELSDSRRERLPPTRSTPRLAARVRNGKA